MEKNKNLMRVIQRLQDEVARLRKTVVDSWGDIPGEFIYTKDTKELHHGDT